MAVITQVYLRCDTWLWQFYHYCRCDAMLYIIIISDVMQGYDSSITTVNSEYLKRQYFKGTVHIKRYRLKTFPIFLYSATPVFSNYQYLKVNFLGPENLL